MSEQWTGWLAGRPAAAAAARCRRQHVARAPINRPPPLIYLGPMDLRLAGGGGEAKVVDICLFPLIDERSDGRSGWPPIGRFARSLGRPAGQPASLPAYQRGQAAASLRAISNADRPIAWAAVCVRQLEPNDGFDRTGRASLISFHQLLARCKSMARSRDKKLSLVLFKENNTDSSNTATNWKDKSQPKGPIGPLPVCVRTRLLVA